MQHDRSTSIYTVMAVPVQHLHMAKQQNKSYHLGFNLKSVNTDKTFKLYILFKSTFEEERQTK